MKNILFILLIILSLNSLAQYNIPKDYIVGYEVDLWLPDTIYVAEGNSIKLYNDNVAYIPITKKDRVSFKWISSVGNSTALYYNFKATTIGNFDVKCICIDYLGQKVDSIETIIKVETKKALGNKTILAIGNSLTYGGWQYMSASINDSLDITASFIGTQKVDPYKNEGRSGWTTASFISVGSPFWIGGKLDFQAYLTNNSFVTPDIIRISLGINDCFALGNTNSMITNLQTLITAIRKDVPDAKIIVSTLSIASNTYWGWLANYLQHQNYESYVLKVRELNKKIYIAFNETSVNTYSDYCTLTVDRDNDYPKAALKHTDALHLKSTGYPNLIKGNLNIINHAY